MEELNILYVDKRKTAQRLLGKVLKPIAHFSAAETLAQAREKVAEQTFSFFVTDYEFPDGTGLDLARALRSDPRHTETPILLYTASLNNELAFEAMQVGINDSLAKPTDLLDLRSRIAQMVEVPEIKSVQRELLQVTCVAWTADGKYHEYSPDLNLYLQGDDRDQVREKMQEALENEVLAKSDPSQCQVDASVIKHIINLSAQPTG